jgi:hypothetical protein
MRSPFLIFEEFISPLQCEEIVIGNDNNFPNYDKQGKIQPLFFYNKFAEVRLTPQIADIVVPKVESHYNVEVKGITEFEFEWYPAGYEGTGKLRYENSSRINGSWQRINDHDFTGVIFLNDYNDKTPFDDEFEVYGGSLEFPTHEFSFNPVRGTLVLFPGAPNFANHVSAVHAGESTLIRFHVATHDPYEYNMQEFPGDYRTWF